MEDFNGAQFENRVHTLVQRALEVSIELREDYVLKECKGEKALFDAVWVEVKKANEVFWEKVKSIVDGAFDLPPDKRESYALKESKGEDALFNNVMIWIKADELDLPFKLDQLKPGTLVNNRYSIISDGPIGEGGMGEVYQAVDLNVDRPIALKRLTRMSAASIQQFHKEARLLAKLNHEGIPTVYDHFNEGNEAFLAMDFIPGHDLWERIFKNDETFAISDILNWTHKLLRILDYLHNFVNTSSNDRSNGPDTPGTHTTVPAENLPKTLIYVENTASADEQRRPVAIKQIIHRDIKPGNIKVNGDKLSLLDFGIAKGPDTTSTGSVAYTPQYAAPEQILQQETSVQSDLYSVGATLYALITGMAPVRGDMRTDNRDPLRPVHKIRSGLPYGLSGFVRKAMEIDPGKRPASAREMLVELEKIRHWKKRMIRRAAVAFSAVLLVGCTMVWALHVFSGSRDAVSEAILIPPAHEEVVSEASTIEERVEEQNLEYQKEAPVGDVEHLAVHSSAQAQEDSVDVVPGNDIIHANLVMLSENFPVTRGFILIDGDSIDASKWVDFPFSIRSYRIEAQVNGFVMQEVRVRFGEGKENRAQFQLTPDPNGLVTLNVQPDMVGLSVTVVLQRT